MSDHEYIHRTYRPNGKASADTEASTCGALLFPITMNVHCIVHLNSRGTSYRADISDCCPMGFVSILIEDEQEDGPEMDISVEDAEALIEALKIIVARRKP